jgi:hypothetical protein
MVRKEKQAPLIPVDTLAEPMTEQQKIEEIEKGKDSDPDELEDLITKKQC